MLQQRFRTILMFGPPGVGKGTQGQVLGCLPGYRHVSSGECFRALDSGSPTAKEASSYIERGELAPDDLTFRVWKQAMQRLITEGQFDPDTDLLILDGIPRNVEQAKALADHIDVLCLVSLVCCDEDAMVERIKKRALAGGRPDDADETVIRRRFDVYRRDTEPVLKYYPDDVMREVDALRSPAEVLQGVLDCVVPVQTLRLSGATR